MTSFKARGGVVAMLTLGATLAYGQSAARVPADLDPESRQWIWSR